MAKSPATSSPSTLLEDIIPTNVVGSDTQSSGQVNNNSADPFYIHPAENPNATLVTPVLTGDSYASWSVNMERALTVKAKSGMLMGLSQNQLMLHKFYYGKEQITWSLLDSCFCIRRD